MVELVASSYHKGLKMRIPEVSQPVRINPSWDTSVFLAATFGAEIVDSA